MMAFKGADQSYRLAQMYARAKPEIKDMYISEELGSGDGRENRGHRKRRRVTSEEKNEDMYISEVNDRWLS